MGQDPSYEQEILWTSRSLGLSCMISSIQYAVCLGFIARVSGSHIIQVKFHVGDI